MYDSAKLFFKATVVLLRALFREGKYKNLSQTYIYQYVAECLFTCFHLEKILILSVIFVGINLVVMPEYLKLPLRFEQFFEKNKMDTCTLQHSIFRNLHLLITTTVGENKQDARYGSAFWDYDYDIHLSNDARREMVIESLTQQITLYEKRLSDVVVEVNVKQTPVNESGNVRLRRRIEIIVSGNLTRSSEPFRFATGFFIGPMSFD